MATGKKIRLFRIASEINIGKDTIVEFLNSKGFDVKNKPTTSLNVEMQELVYDKFKKEKKAAEIQRNKIEKHRKSRRTLEEIADELRLKEEQEAAIELASKEDIVSSEEIASKIEPAQNEEKATKEVTRKKVSDKKEKAIAKETSSKKEKSSIDDKNIKLDETKNKKSESHKKIIDLKETEKITEEIKTVTKKKEIDKPKTAKQNKSIVDKKTVDKKTEPKQKKTEKVTPKKLDDKEDNKEIVTLDKIETKAQDTKTTEEKTKEALAKNEKEQHEDIAANKSKKRRKRKTVAEVENADGEVHQLKGLKIVGKIELNKKKAHQKPFKKQTKTTKPVKEQQEKKESETQTQPKRKSKAKDRRKKKRISVRDLIKDKDINKAMKDTLSNMNETSVAGQRSKLRQKKKAEREVKEQHILEEKEIEAKILKLTEFVTTAALSEIMNINVNDVILKCMELGLMVTLNQRLDKDTITLIADDFGFEVEFLDDKTAQLIFEEEEEEEDESKLEPRPPIVTVMGHVDHGKTSLLDFIRKTRVVAGEAGGITQHMGAYKVDLKEGKSITFLDTPGHEAFTAMRARGAQVTDIVVLIIAADDSVMPQTLEAISHSQAANVPIIVAINKVDKPDANPERIKQQLSEHNILVEDWGGKYQCIEISAKSGKNIDLLLEKILLEAEMLDLKANPNRNTIAAVIEANMQKGLGTVSTLIMQKGTLKIGDAFVCGVYSGRVRAMFDERGNNIEQAGPSYPVRVIGFNGLPSAGDIFMVTKSDIEARHISSERQQLKREQEFKQVHLMTLDDISRQIKLGGVKDLYIIIKGDVSGSIEALSDSLQKQSTEEVRVVVLHKGVGSITESDVMLAVASRAIIVGFQVSPTANARKLAETEHVDIRLYSIIYDAINEVRLALEGLLSPELRENITATIEVRQVFKISKLGYIAGCSVREGKITRNDRVRVLREGLTVYNGTLHSLKREKDDVKEVNTGYECGIMLEGFNDIEVDDIIEAYKLLEIKRTL